MAMRVMLVFEETYGSRDKPQLGDAFWMVDTPANRALAEKAWKDASTDPNSAVFQSHSPARAQDVIGKVQDIDVHQPDWSEIVLVGVERGDELMSELEAEGLAIIATSGALAIRRNVR